MVVIRKRRAMTGREHYRRHRRHRHRELIHENLRYHINPLGILADK